VPLLVRRHTKARLRASAAEGTPNRASGRLLGHTDEANDNFRSQ